MDTVEVVDAPMTGKADEMFAKEGTAVEFCIVHLNHYN